MSPRPSAFSVFRHRSFALLWSGQFISYLGGSITKLAASILVFQETGSALSVGLMLIATTAPTLLVGLVAGVFVDRWDRKRIMVFADCLRALLVALIPLLIRIDLVWLFISVALVSAITQFFESAQASVLPDTVPDEDLSAAAAWMTIATIGSTTIGFAVAGWITAHPSIEWAFYLNALSFMVSAGLLRLAHLPRHEESGSSSLRAIRDNLREGLRTVSATPILRSLFLVLIPIFLLFGLQNAWLLPFAVRELHGTTFDFGLQQSAESIGITLGSLLMARYMGRLHDGQWLALSIVAMGLASLLYSLSTAMTPAIVFMAAIGFANAPFCIGRTVIIQRATPREQRGRVNSALFVMRDAVYVLAMALAGLADLFNVRTLMVLDSAALVVAGLVLLILPGLRQPIAEWKRILSMLAGSEVAPRLGAGRAATRYDIDRFVALIPALNGLSHGERERLAARTFVAEAPPGKMIICRGELGDMAYCILRGSVVVGYLKDDDYLMTPPLGEGSFVGEIGALTGIARTANVITRETSELLIVSSSVLRELSSRHEGLRRMFLDLLLQRLKMIEPPQGAGLVHGALRELRTPQGNGPSP